MADVVYQASHLLFLPSQHLVVVSFVGDVLKKMWHHEGVGSSEAMLKVWELQTGFDGMSRSATVKSNQFADFDWEIELLFALAMFFLSLF